MEIKTENERATERTAPGETCVPEQMFSGAFGTIERVPRSWPSYTRVVTIAPIVRATTRYVCGHTGTRYIGLLGFFASARRYFSRHYRERISSPPQRVPLRVSMLVSSLLTLRSARICCAPRIERMKRLLVVHPLCRLYTRNPFAREMNVDERVPSSVARGGNVRMLFITRIERDVNIGRVYYQQTTGTDQCCGTIRTIIVMTTIDCVMVVVVGKKLFLVIVLVHNSNITNSLIGADETNRRTELLGSHILPYI